MAITSPKILELEFNYAKEATLMAQDDRLKIVNFYLGLYTTTITIFFGLENLTNKSFSSYAFIILFMLALISLIFTIQLVRLRQAWFESIRTMNVIKKFFTDKDSDLKKYLPWSVDTLPKVEKFRTVSYMSALVIDILGSIAFGLALVSSNNSADISILVSLAFFIALQSIYYFMLKKNW